MTENGTRPFKDSRSITLIQYRSLTYGMSSNLDDISPSLVSNPIIIVNTPHRRVTYHTHPPYRYPKGSSTRTSYLTTLSTHFSSTLLTSSLNRSTSRQQSNGLRSFPLKHFTTSSLAFSTSLSNDPTSTTFFRFSSLCLRSSMLCWMTARFSVRSRSPSEELLGSEGDSSDDNLALRSLKVCSSRSRRRLSSSATRA